MGGTNPYIEKADVALPQKSYIVTFIFPDKTEKKVEVQPDKIPYGPTGLPGSILDIAMGNGIDLEHVCGGVCACSFAAVNFLIGWAVAHIANGVGGAADPQRCPGSGYRSCCA